MSRLTRMRGTRAIAVALAALTFLIPTTGAWATALTTDAKNLRTQAAEAMDSYLLLYGDRFTPAESTTLEGLSRTADTELAKVQRAVAKAEKTSAANKTKKAAALRAALRAHTQAKLKAETSFTSARNILQRRLSIFEALSALSDYEELMTAYDQLGTALQKQASALR